MFRSEQIDHRAYSSPIRLPEHSSTCSDDDLAWLTEDLALQDEKRERRGVSDFQLPRTW